MWSLKCETLNWSKVESFVIIMGITKKKKRYNFHPPSCMKHHSTKIKTKKRLGMNKESWKEKIKSIT